MGPTSDGTLPRSKRIAPRVIVVSIVAAVALLLAGCRGPSAYREALSFSGAGARSVEIVDQHTVSRTLSVSFFCTSGSYILVVVEAPGTRMNGRCGRNETFAMRIPPVHTVHLEIGLREDSIYDLRVGFVG